MALLFGIFGILSIIGNIYFLPVIILRLYKITFFRNLSRDIVRLSWSFFLFCARVCGYLRCEYSGDFKSLNHIKSCIVIANHPSLLDVMLIISKIRHIDCIVKASLRKNIFLYPAIKASNYILNTENEILLKKATNILKSGESLLIFPEGTRTKEHIVFHKASSYIAINAAKKLAKILIKINPRSLQKGRKWYDTPSIRVNYKIKLVEVLELKNYEKMATNAIRTRRLHKQLSEFYIKEWNNG